MKPYVVTDQTTRYTRISKAKARSLWGTVDIALCPVKLRPGWPWAPHIIVDHKAIQRDLQSEYDFVRDAASFDSAVQNFQWYNCTCNETGKYVAFYLVEPL